MRIEHALPRAHVIVDDFFAPTALPTIFREIAKLEPHLRPGLVRDIGHDGQSVFFENPRRKNHAVWLHDPSKILGLFREHLWSPAMVAWFDTAREPLFQIIPNCSSPNLQVSRYMTGDHYDFHEDEGAGVNLTAIVFLAARPEKIRGGDLTLVYDGEEAKIRFRHNRLVIFPSKTLHRVTRVRVDSSDPADARISLQSWLTFGRPVDGAKNAKNATRKTDAPSPAKARRAEAEADRPTFLLAEEPILGAAQVLLAPPEVEHSPDELYWGAFYVSRILTQNLRWLAMEAELAPGPVRMRRIGEGAGSDALEVSLRGRSEGNVVRVGFSIRGDVAPAEAMTLFVEKGGRGARDRAARLVPAGAEAADVHAVLKALLRRLSASG